jgi:hypothetical protein
VSGDWAYFVDYLFLLADRRVARMDGLINAATLAAALPVLVVAAFTDCAAAAARRASVAACCANHDGSPA